MSNEVRFVVEEEEEEGGGAATTAGDEEAAAGARAAAGVSAAALPEDGAAPKWVVIDGDAEEARNWFVATEVGVDGADPAVRKARRGDTAAAAAATEGELSDGWYSGDIVASVGNEPSNPESFV